MSQMFDFLSAYAPWQDTLNAVDHGQTVALYDMTESQRAFFAAELAASGRRVLYVAPNEAAARRASADLARLLGEKSAMLPGEDIRFVQGAASRDLRWERAAQLTRVASGEVSLLCVGAEMLMQPLPAPEDVKRRVLRVASGDILPPQSVVDTLCSWGYERVDMVEGKGQCALRGDILDVFPPAAISPLRVEFFDDEVDSIRPFDALTQRSGDSIAFAVLSAVHEYVLPADKRAAAADKMECIIRSAMRAQDALSDSYTLDEEAAPAAAGVRSGYHRMMLCAQALRETGSFSDFALWAPLLDDSLVTVERFFESAVVVLDTPERVIECCEDRMKNFAEELSLAHLRAEAVPEQISLLYSPDEVRARLSRAACVTMQDLLRGMAGLKIQKTIQMKGLSASRYQGRFRLLADDIKALTAKGYAIAILAGGEARSERIRAALNDFGCVLPENPADEPCLVPGKTCLTSMSLSRGFVMDDAKLLFITDTDLYGQSRKKAQARDTGKARIDSFVELSPGDYVVHEHHGIGVYQGTVRLQSEGTWRDYLLINYKGTDKLYVPTDQFDRVQKYIGGQGDAPPLNDLSGTAWEKQKNRVRQSLQKLAFSLVELYAKRMNTPGFAFPKAGAWEEQFNDNFEWELTPDQQAAINDVFSDMERPINMDRLLCGDVGYGKTEVAMRAAFRAVMGGRQVAVLAPTTILAQQHYATFKKRFAGFPVEIGVVSRFRTAKSIKETILKAKEGKLDILIGTHRLLSKDVAYKSLGLLIVDEEQRFGVAHKESIKNMKTSVDVLTLSATPIPRTLHMGMVGVRDMSLLESPPEARLPVQSYVVDYHDGIVRDAILREKARGGQVFFLFNRVRQIDAFAARLRGLVPEVRVSVAHGQMRDNALEDIMADFAAGNSDVLLATTIIENGIDIPLANTLIVFDADRFGLSQLYQLRGRVGRSDRAAYAYFMVKGDRALTEDAQKRLAAIKEFTEFGAGFRIAMRDLEIRGAGNIFGPEQSGQVSVIGYDMYCKMIEEAVREARGDFSLSKESRRETRVELHVDAFLPDSYVSGQTQRVEIYKRISSIRTKEDKLTLIDDLIDRFGEPPEPVLTLMDISSLRALSMRVGCDLVTFQSGYLTLRLKSDYVDDPAALVSALAKVKKFTLTGGRRPAILFKPSRGEEACALRECLSPLASLVRETETAAESKKQPV